MATPLPFLVDLELTDLEVVPFFLMEAGSLPSLSFTNQRETHLHTRTILVAPPTTQIWKTCFASWHMQPQTWWGEVTEGSKRSQHADLGSNE